MPATSAGMTVEIDASSVRSHVRFFHHPRNRGVGIELLEPWIDLTGEHADAVHGVVMFQESGLSHDQQMAVAADMVPVFLDLLEDRVGRDAKHGAGFDPP